MSTTTTFRGSVPGDIRLSPIGVIRSEWIKFGSLRSIRLSLLSAMFLMSAGTFMLTVNAVRGDDASGVDPLAGVQNAAQLGVLPLFAVGAIAATSEYSSGSIRSSLAAVPSRLPVLLSKVLVALVATYLSLAMSLAAAILISRPTLAGKGLRADLTDPGVLTELALAAAFLTAIMLVSLSLGALIRSTALTVSIMLLWFYVAPVALVMAIGNGANLVFRYFPSSLGYSIMNVDVPANALSPATALLVFTGYIVVLLGLAAARLLRSDA